MMAQYRRLRGELPPDTFLFFRLGDFYEMFFEDAVEAARLLEITLTRRQGVPMCGVPYHAAAAHITRLLQAGRKVAICEQTEDPALARGLVRREITRIVTPGTLIEESPTEPARNNYLAGVHRFGGVFGLALLEVSTGAFQLEEFERADELRETLARHAPAECVFAEEQRDDPELRAAIAATGALATAAEDWTFLPDAAVERLIRHFRVHSLDGFGCADRRAALSAAGALLDYVGRTLRRDISHIRRLSFRRGGDYLAMDPATAGHLEIAPPASAIARGAAGPSLIGVLDATRTAMGGRLLREWLLRPLARLDAIQARHAAVAALLADRERERELRERLGAVRDLERLIVRLSAGAGNARDLRAVADSLDALPAIRALADSGDAPLLRALAEQIEPQPELVERIRQTIVDEPPATTREGGMIRAGCHPELDELRAAGREGHRWLAEYQAAEQQRTGIKSLKVRYNQVFGYYIEISKSQLAAAPAEYIRKQTLVNAERFITPELKQYENRILGAQERAVQLESDLFQELRSAVVAATEAIQRSAAAVAELDVLSAFAERAAALGYVRPAMNEGDTIRIRGGRHPVVEQLPGAERFVPNDTLLNSRDHQVIVITGPNMAGKSTYIRQVALIVLMAQAGSFVPAAEAEIGLVDRIFTRIGAGDDIARGRSTFMVEMQETANILNNLTPRSLIVLDEIGRGTSTFDGISIAWAVAEHLHNRSDARARTLFATHYHELTDLARELDGVKNYNVAVRESGDRVVFLRKILPGAADQSYGIHVARLAGMPPEVLERAKEILTNLEEGEFGESGQPKIARRRARRSKGDDRQLSLL